MRAAPVLAWLQREPGFATVRKHLEGAKNEGGEACIISAINLGEIYYRLARGRGREAADRFWEDVRSAALPLEVIEATLPRVRAAARLKARHRLSYADAFAVAAAVEHGAPLLTGDPEILALEDVEGLNVVRLPRR
ncbi:MAG: PIN domain-containing protein [Deltaproteobacteria bacterium]|nr:PIN domain-containing protein [Deltaproteobacteria bacterium]